MKRTTSFADKAHQLKQAVDIQKGIWLIKEKHDCGTGDWGLWLQANGLSRSTADRLMKLAKSSGVTTESLEDGQLQLGIGDDPSRNPLCHLSLRHPARRAAERLHKAINEMPAENLPEVLKFIRKEIERIDKLLAKPDVD